MVAVRVCSVLTLLVDGYHVSFSRRLWGTCPVFQVLLKDFQEFGLYFGAKVFQHLLGNFVGARRFLVSRGFKASSNSFMLNGLYIIILRWVSITLVALEFVLYFLLPVVLCHSAVGLLIAVYEAICCFLPCHCLLAIWVMTGDDSLFIIHSLGLFPTFVAFSAQVKLF